MSFQEDRRSNGNTANNLTVRYIDTRPRPRDMETDVRERERFERCRIEREERERQNRWLGWHDREMRYQNNINSRYYEGQDRDRTRDRDNRDSQNCKMNHYENTRWWVQIQSTENRWSDTHTGQSVFFFSWSNEFLVNYIFNKKYNFLAGEKQLYKDLSSKTIIRVNASKFPVSYS